MRISILSAFIWSLSFVAVQADNLLDGRVFSGLIGPRENPDLADSLHFQGGHFWSEICTRCGFQPGVYQAQSTDGGIRFSGVLISDSRGRFDYDGFVHEDGRIEVSIQWERRRWYWTSRREIAFEGKAVLSVQQTSLSDIRARLKNVDPDTNPLCARF